MAFKLFKTLPNGVKAYTLLRHKDDRGEFLKVFTTPLSIDGEHVDCRESYITHSHRNVVRGLHFQTPPADHIKLVACLSGSVLDVTVDIRKDSATYGMVSDIHLRADEPILLHIPVGYAHGFKSLEDNSALIYLQSTAYSPENDAGILYSSIGYDWQVEQPILSERDQTFPTFDAFETPF